MVIEFFALLCYSATEIKSAAQFPGKEKLTMRADREFPPVAMVLSEGSSRRRPHRALYWDRNRNHRPSRRSYDHSLRAGIYLLLE
jgi:hypothetical protein